MKIRTDFVTNSSSSSYCVSLAVETDDGNIYDLRVDPHDMSSSGGDSYITLFRDKYKAIIKAKDIEELCDLMFDAIDLDGEFWDDGEITREVCENYGMGDNCDTYAEEMRNSDTSMGKLKVLKKIRDDYYDNEIKEIESSEDTPKQKEKKMKKIQAEKDKDKGRGLATLSDEFHDFKSQLISGVSSIGKIKKVLLSEEHYAWGEFAPESFGDIVDGVLKDNTSCKGVNFALSKKLARNKQIKSTIEERAGAICSRMNKDVNYLIADDDDETDAKIAKAKELSVPIITTREFYEKFNLELDPSDERVMDRLKVQFAEGSDFKGIVTALANYGPCILSDRLDISIDMQSDKIEKSHIIENCFS